MIQEHDYTTEQLKKIHHKTFDEKNFSQHAEKIDQDIRSLGANYYDLIVPETPAIPYVIHEGEQILGLVYGRYTQVEGDVVGRGVLIATPERVILIDRKPLFVKTSEISYRVISAVTYAKVLFVGNVTIHTRMGKINIRTFNQKCAYNFVEAIESCLFEKNIFDYQE